MDDQPLRARATLAVLAGGRGTRMGGPKDRVNLGGKPVLVYLLERFQWIGPTMLVTAPGADAIAGGEKFTQIVADPIEGEGPLRGVLTALTACATKFLIVTTLDTPGWDGDQLNYLLGALESSASLGVMFCHGRQVEPFPIALRADAIAEINARFVRGGRSTRGLSADARFSIITAPLDWPESTWINLNFPTDVEAFERRLKES